MFFFFVGVVVCVFLVSFFFLCLGSMNNHSVWKKSTGFNDESVLVGDEVLFRPKCSEQEIRFLMNLTAFKSLQNPNYLHEIKYILNDYYLFIDVGADSKYAFPMRWVDFEKA